MSCQMPKLWLQRERERERERERGSERGNERQRVRRGGAEREKETAGGEA